MNFGTLNNYNDIFDALGFQIDHDNDADLQVNNDLKLTRTTV